MDLKELPPLNRTDFQPTEDILRLGKTISSFTEDELRNDPKLAYILNK